MSSLNWNPLNDNESYISSEQHARNEPYDDLYSLTNEFIVNMKSHNDINISKLMTKDITKITLDEINRSINKINNHSSKDITYGIICTIFENNLANTLQLLQFKYNTHEDKIRSIIRPKLRVYYNTLIEQCTSKLNEFLETIILKDINVFISNIDSNQLANTLIDSINNDDHNFILSEYTKYINSRFNYVVKNIHNYTSLFK